MIYLDLFQTSTNRFFKLQKWPTVFNEILDFNFQINKVTFPHELLVSNFLTL